MEEMDSAEEIRLEIKKMEKAKERAISFGTGGLGSLIVAVGSYFFANGFLGDKGIVIICSILIKMGLVGALGCGTIALGNYIGSLVNKSKIKELKEINESEDYSKGGMQN